MALSIKNAEAEQLVRQLTAETGETVTRAIIVALRERLERIQRQSSTIAESKAIRMRQIAADAAGRWMEPYRSADHGVLLYDESGLPR